jgi:hypothetical protein
MTPRNAEPQTSRAPDYIAEGPGSAGSITDPDAVLAFQSDVMGRDGGVRNVLTFPPSLP